MSLKRYLFIKVSSSLVMLWALCRSPNTVWAAVTIPLIHYRRRENTINNTTSTTFWRVPEVTSCLPGGESLFRLQDCDRLVTGSDLWDAPLHKCIDNVPEWCRRTQDCRSSRPPFSAPFRFSTFVSLPPEPCRCKSSGHPENNTTCYTVVHVVLLVCRLSSGWHLRIFISSNVKY